MKTSEAMIIALVVAGIALYMAKQTSDSAPSPKCNTLGNVKLVSASGDGCKNPPPIVMPGGWCCFSIPVQPTGPYSPITVEQP